MKRTMVLIAAIMLAALTVCGGQTQNPAANIPPPDMPPVTQPVNPAVPTELPEQEDEAPQAEHILIAYFSLWDNAPWDKDTDTTTSASVEDMEQYDTVLIGYPVWATTLPQAVRTFLTSYDLTGRTVIPFCTHDGYEAERSFSTVAEHAAGANTLEGLAIYAPEVTAAKDSIKRWLGSLGLGTESGQDETAIRITAEDAQLEGVLYDSAWPGSLSSSSLRPSP